MSQDKKQIPYRQRYVIALGSNLPSKVGSSADTLKHALQSLREYGLVVKEISRLFQTPAFPAGNGPDYVNAVAMVEEATNSAETAEIRCARVLAALHAVEHEFGRTRDTRWGQRTLDLDLIAADDAVLPGRDVFQSWVDQPSDQQTLRAPSELIVPHPRMQDRAFVLVPMADIEPDWRHPVFETTVAEMLARLPAPDVEAVIPLDPAE